jgi:SPP1 family predicted phage head-tail adaptor
MLPDGAGSLRHRITIQRRVAAQDGYGNAEGDWVTLIPSLRASLLPLSGGDQVQAARSQGVAAYDCWIRYSRAAAAVTAADRVLNARDLRQEYRIKFVGDLAGDRRWILLQLELGKAA